MRGDSSEAGASADEEDEEDDSLFQLLKAYLLTAEENFTRDSQSLHLIFRIVGAVWQSAASRAIGTSNLHELQQRLRKEVPQFWEHLTHCLTAEIQDAPVSTHARTHTLSSTQLAHPPPALLRACFFFSFLLPVSSLSPFPRATNETSPRRTCRERV